MTTAQRLADVRDQFEEWQIDGLLITSAANRRWLSGFAGSAGELLITANDAILITDFRYWQQAQNQAPAFVLHRWQRTVESLPDLFRSVGVTRLGIEANHLTVADYAKFKRLLGDQGRLVSLADTLEPLRAVKTDAEIAAIRAAAAITDVAMARVNELVRVGMTERELAWQLEKLMRENGADGLAFETIVASGPNAALPHHRPSDRQLQAGDALVVDMGAAKDGYNSDMTRSFYLGATPSEAYRRVYDVVLAAHGCCIDQIQPGMTGKTVDALARDSIAATEFADYFGHGLGHGVGLVIHERPRLSSVSDDVMTPNMVITVEPGVYLPDWGGVRIEDLVLVTPTGVEFLSHCAKNPIIPV